MRSILIIICCVIASIRAHGDLELVQVQVVFRHGDRTPIINYPGDPNSENQWKKYGGFGQLTHVGMMRQFKFGEYLRTRYEHFLSKSYNRNQVIVKSTNYDRTIMSAQSLLAGLYKPTDYQVWNADVLWQPIPVRTADLDSLFIPKCPRYDQLSNEIFSSEEFTKSIAKYKDLIQLAAEKTNSPEFSIKNLWILAEASLIEKSNNLSLPQWVEQNFPLLIESLGEQLYFKFKTEEMARLTGGGILNEVKSNINSAVKGNSTLQLALFSSHATYIAALIKLLGFNQHLTFLPFSSSIIFELKKSKTSTNYYVLAYLKNNTETEAINPILLPITGCGNMCPLDDFMRIIERKVVDNPSVACAKKSPPVRPLSLLKNSSFMISVIFALLCSLLVSYYAVKTMRRTVRLRSGYRAQEL